MEGCTSNIWDELNVSLFSGFSGWKYLGDICTMKGATVKKVALKSFEEQGLISLSANLQLSQPPLYVFHP